MDGYTESRTMVRSGKRRTEGVGNMLAPWVSKHPTPCLADRGPGNGSEGDRARTTVLLQL